jgi:NTP pyrophosphatase (non-canonical NTP hydrolase)
MSKVLQDVQTERERQDAKWGISNNSPMEWVAILSEEMGEVARAAMNNFYRGESLTAYRAELVQVAAVAVAAIENLDRSEVAA